MRTRLSLMLAAAAGIATALVLAFPSLALAGTYTGPTVYCNGTCPAPDQHCIPANAGQYPILCSGNGSCPVGGQLGCRAGTPCAYWATWDCKCYIEGGGYAGSCTRD